VSNETPTRRRISRRLVAGGLITTAAIMLAACGSSSDDKATETTSASSTPTTTAGETGVTIATADVAGVGTVLVNAKDGRTLYLLTSEQGGKITCTDDNGCTKVWPATELPSGVTAATAGMDVDAAKLGTVKSEDGDLYVTYGGYPLYEFAKDTAPAEAKGQGISSFGGTWWVVSPSGTPVTAAASSVSSTVAPTTRSGY
jgi:predicted lipoprotein with Yx(FWY)xxD motif